MLSVIIVSYNTKEILATCLDRVLESDTKIGEIIVVDNASSDGSLQMLEEKYPNIKIIRNSSNLGFGKANNQAMQVAKYEYLLLLNSDAFVERDTIRLALGIFEKNNLYGVVGGRYFNQDGSFQPSFGYFPSTIRIISKYLFLDHIRFVNRLLGSIHASEENLYQNAREVEWVSGAFMLIKSDVYKKTGGFNEDFFMYGEEIEWQYRISKCGFKSIYSPVVKLQHLGGASSNRKENMFIGEIKGYKKWINIYSNPMASLVVDVAIFVGVLARVIIFGVFGKKQLTTGYWKTLVYLLAR